MFSPSEWRILLGLLVLFGVGAGWHLVDAGIPLPPLTVQGGAVVWTDPADPGTMEVSPEASTPAKPGKRAPAHRRKPLLTGPVNPNLASLEQLQGLPGVGEKMAQRIVDERANGRFKNADDLRRVKGIGVKKAEKMRPWLTFD